jgi:hypothetical protein
MAPRRSISRRSSPSGEPLPYLSRTFLASLAELRFHHALSAALPEWLLVCPKVRVADVISCSEEDWKRGFGGAISQKHFDFVIASRESLRIACCIELDDKSHERPERERRDAFLDAALDGAGIPLLRFQARAEYDSNSIRRRILSELQRARLRGAGGPRRRGTKEPRARGGACPRRRRAAAPGATGTRDQGPWDHGATRTETSKEMGLRR